MLRLPLRHPPFPYTTLFRSIDRHGRLGECTERDPVAGDVPVEQAQEVVVLAPSPSRSRLSTAARTTTSWACSTGTSPATGSDRKSTRLNSSHITISYAVFCLNAPPAT